MIEKDQILINLCYRHDHQGQELYHVVIPKGLRLDRYIFLDLKNFLKKTFKHTLNKELYYKEGQLVYEYQCDLEGIKEVITYFLSRYYNLSGNKVLYKTLDYAYISSIKELENQFS